MFDWLKDLLGKDDHNPWNMPSNSPVLEEAAKKNPEKLAEEKKKAQEKANQEAAKNAADKAEWDEQVSDAKSGSATNSKQQRMVSTIKAVSSMLAKNPVYSMFIEFSMNSGNLHVSTVSTKTNENIIMALQNNKNGSGQANSFTLTIAYSPQAGDEFDVNLIDRAISAANTPEQAANLRYCTIQYGYANRNEEIYRSPKYQGMVLNYTCEIQDGVLIYTITGFSGITMLKESKEALALKLPASGKMKPTVAAKQLVEVYLQGKVQGSDALTPDDASGSTVSRIERNPLDTAISYELIWEGDTFESDAEVSLSTQLDKNPASALTDILNKAIYQSDMSLLNSGKSIPATSKTTYGWYISDVSSNTSLYPSGSICIYKSTPEEDEKITNVIPELVFNWMSPGLDNQSNHIVISFKPEYEGSVLMAITAGESMDTVSYFQDDTGAIVATENSIAPPVGGSKEAAVATAEQEKASWARQAQYPYKATLVTVGIPAEIPILTKIKIRPLIYGQEHFSGGIYQVLKVSDQLDLSGFRTTWELIKLTRPVQTGSVNISNSNSGESSTTANESSTSNTSAVVPAASVVTSQDKLNLNEGPISDKKYNELTGNDSLLDSSLNNPDPNSVWSDSITHNNPLNNR